MAYHAETLLTKIDALEPNPLMMALAGQVILEGGLVAFPTETVYGLGANALSPKAVSHIFEAKHRPSNDPLIVHIWEIAQLEQVAIDIPDMAHQLVELFWPGALTLILKRHPDIPDSVTAGQDTVAIRLPSHPIAQALIRKAGVPIAAPSANRFSRPSPTSAQHVMNDLEGHVDVILDGGNTHIGVESTIVDLTSAVPTVLRPGGISLEELRRYLPSLAFHPRHILDDEIAPAPGTLLKHYSPNAQVLVFIGSDDLIFDVMRQKANNLLSDEQKVGIMVLDDDVLHFEDIVAQYVMLGKDKEAMAATLFAGMRELDTVKVDVILVRAPEQEGLGLAVYDRLLRAAEGQVIEVIGENNV